MYFSIVCLITIILSGIVRSEICVLEKLVTLSHPLCAEKTSCSDYVQVFPRKKRDETNNDTIIYLMAGSPSLSHFKSVEDEPSPSPISVSLFEKSLNVARRTGKICDENSTYRSYDGSCNNLKHPTWGVTDSEMLRILPARYGFDGGLPRSVTGASLPLPRILSYKIFTDKNRPSVRFTLAVMQWGQLLAHDTGKSPSFFKRPVDCCATINKECCSIKVPLNDPFYSKYNQTCINMVRTRAINKRIDCKNVPYQIAAVSHPIDLSELYGSTFDVAQSIRQHEDGLLDVHITKNGREFPKLSNNPGYDCNLMYANETCFESGDSRVNQNTELTCLQTVLLREHNRIANILSELNPWWEDEKLYQESRAILIAQYQHISYNEWLPLILGDEYMKKHDLYPLKEGFTKYKDDINLSTLNIFMTAAYRVFHSQIQGRLYMYNSSGCPYKYLNISDWMNRPGIIMKQDNFDSLLRGLSIEPSQDTDRYFTTQMTELMFHGPFPYGEDLESFDIQRGRDHGLPSYNDARELCNKPRAKNFRDLIRDIDENLVKLLSELYHSVDDIDLFVGGTLEKETLGSNRTFWCLIGEQFVRKKFGDRFWYEHGRQASSFSEEQLQEIRKSTLARLICDNSDNITEIQPNVFHFSSVKGNNVVSCKELPVVNLTKWKDNE